MKKQSRSQNQIAVIYARYSSHNQREVSIEQQIEECQAYADAHGFRVVEVFSDKKVTGKTDKRPSFQRMMRNAERGNFQVIIAYKSNRLARNMANALACEEKLSGFGVRVVYAKEEFGDNAAGRFALRTMMNVNQFYSENMAEDIMRGLRDNASRCLVNTALPFGYKRGSDGRYEIVESEADIVREIFQRIHHGEQFVDIARSLNERGIRTRQGNEWGRSSFHRITSNIRYTGVYIYQDIRIEDGIPKIIDKELFDAVNYHLSNKKNPQGRRRLKGEYLLTGKLFCGKCSSPMVGISGTGKSGDMYYYYACNDHRKRKSCDKLPVRRDWAEQLVADAVRRYVLRDDVIAWIAKTVIAYKKKRSGWRRMDALQAQLDENAKAKRNILAAMEQGIITVTTKDRLLELEAIGEKLEAKLSVERLRTPNVTKEQIIFWLEGFRDNDITDKRFQATLFDTFLVAAFLCDGELRLVFNHTGQRSTVSVPIEADIGNGDLSTISECSYKLPSAPPLASCTNTDVIIYMIDDVFVLALPLLPKVDARHEEISVIL